MRVCILGNMNNNGFSLLRYFSDLGVDANLYLYLNDGHSGNAHFKPENDTFDFERWQHRIHKTLLLNAPYHTFPSTVVRLLSLLRKFKRGESRCELQPLSKSYVSNTFKSFDGIVASGYGAAILNRVSIGTDIFYPYALGIEGVNGIYYPKIWNFVSLLVFLAGRRNQIRALRKVRNSVSFDISITADTFRELGINCLPMGMPLVYVRESLPESTGDSNVDFAGSVVSQCDFSVMMHASLSWTEESCGKENNRWSKNNDWLIRAFKNVVDARPKLKCKLIIVEYGPDLVKSKKLVSELGLDNHVLWIPQTGRKNILWLLQKVTIGAGEFIESHGLLWGGTGWEVLASGKPLLQGFYFEDGEFDRAFGYPPPPMLPVQNQKDVLAQLLRIADNPEQGRKMGRDAKEWFDRYNGIGLAKKWLELLESPSTPANRIGEQTCRD